MSYNLTQFHTKEPRILILSELSKNLLPEYDSSSQHSKDQGNNEHYVQNQSLSYIMSLGPSGVHRQDTVCKREIQDSNINTSVWGGEVLCNH